jgi:hypothetical protein
LKRPGTCSSVPMRLGKSLLQRSAIRTPTSNPDKGLKINAQQGKAKKLVTNLFEDTFMHPGFRRRSAACGWAALKLNEGGEEQLKAGA